MALNPSTSQGQVLKFHTPAADPGVLLVLSVAGRDAISRGYEFRIELASQKKTFDATTMLGEPAMLTIKHGIRTRDGKLGVQTLRYHGVLAEFEHGDVLGDWTTYRAVLVPNLWKLSLNRRSRIFQKQTTPKMLETILKEHGFQKGDYELRLTGSYVEHEYVVQHQESDLDFVARRLEREGIFYYFKEGDSGEKVIFADHAGAHEPILGATELRYQPIRHKAGPGLESGVEAWFQDEFIQSAALRHRRIPGAVELRDYNYRTPSVDLKAEAPVVPHGYGRVYLFGEHYKKKEEGVALAKIRAEELRCREKELVGKSDGRAFRAGATFTLADHPSGADAFNRSFLLVEVRTFMEQMMPAGGIGKFAATYRNEFTAIPADVVFRPARTTPVPHAAGTINATVDAAGDGTYAEIDDEGRYKVRIPFDPGQGKGTASRYLRMMQPYAGGGMGMHFPLHAGTEVMLVHVNGDWDRPVIAGAIPNPSTKSPVTGGNSTQCLIATGGGNQILIEDADAGQKIKLFSPTAKSMIGIGAPPE
jgi:type VI secretion system secreted protein VgrG